MQNAMAKVDSIIAEHPDLSLDDLVATRKINADQRAQALKKPALLQQLNQAEEQLTLYKTVHQWHEDRLQAEKARLELAMEQRVDEYEGRLRDLKGRNEQGSNSESSLKLRLLTLSRFLRAAAARRQSDADEKDVSTQAFEGVLLAFYGGDSNAAFAMEKLIEGSDDRVSAPDGTVLDLTCKWTMSHFHVSS